MEALGKLYALFIAHQKDIFDAVAYLVLLGSVVVKVTPTVKDNNYFLPIIKFIGRYIALDKYGPKDRSS